MSILPSSSSSSNPPFISKVNPKRILIIGGGASGLVTLRNLTHKDPGSESGPFDEVMLYERREDVGGVWNLDSKTVKLEATFPNGTSQDNWPLTPPRSEGPSFKPKLWPSPSYPQLRGNVLPRFLSFSMTKFPPPSNNEVFPTLSETHDYLKDFSKPLKDSIKVNIEVVAVYELPPTSTKENQELENGGWRVIIKDWNQGGKVEIQSWDVVILASGWTEKEYYPNTKGLEKAKELGKVHHAKWYRNPEIYRNKRLIVTGNGNSSNDISAHLAELNPLPSFTQNERNSFEPVYRSIRHEAYPLFVSLPDERIKDVPEVQEYLVGEDGRLNVELKDGNVIKDVDMVICGTGYQIGSFPFVHLLNRTPTSKDTQDIQNLSASSPPNLDLYSPLASTKDFPQRVSSLYYQVVHARNPTLAFVGLPISHTPFVSSDLTSWFIRSIYDSSFSLPSTLSSRLEYEEKRVRILQERKTKSTSILETLKNNWLNQKQKGDKNVKAAPKGLPFSLHFHILGGTDEMEFSREVRDLITGCEKKNWLDQFLDKWDMEREEARFGMYALKYEALSKRRDMLERGNDGGR